MASTHGEPPRKSHKNHIVSWSKVRHFLNSHPQHANAEEVFGKWYKLLEISKLDNFGDLRRVFPTADKVGVHVVINVGGNKFRVVLEVYYHSCILIRHVLTHKEYDDGSWKQ